MRCSAKKSSEPIFASWTYFRGELWFSNWLPTIINLIYNEINYLYSIYLYIPPMHPRVVASIAEPIPGITIRHHFVQDCNAAACSVSPRKHLYY